MLFLLGMLFLLNNFGDSRSLSANHPHIATKNEHTLVVLAMKMAQARAVPIPFLSHTPYFLFSFHCGPHIIYDGNLTPNTWEKLRGLRERLCEGNRRHGPPFNARPQAVRDGPRH